MAGYGIIFLGKKLTQDCLSGLRSINEYMAIDLGGKGLQLRQSPSATGGPGGTCGAHTTVGVAVGAIWSGSRKLLSTDRTSCVVHRNTAIWLGA